MKFLSLCMFTLVATVLIGCESGPESPRGFSLPKGDEDRGLLVFQKYQCLACHELEGVAKVDVVDNPDLQLKLGGESAQIKTYAELVTSIINPSHKIAKGYPQLQMEGVSKMAIYNEVMTVQELVDLVTFLQPKYKLVPHIQSDYRIYRY